MNQSVFSIIGGAALASVCVLSAGCLPAYDAAPAANKTQTPTDTGPEANNNQVSGQPTPVRPASPTDEAVAWTEGGDPALIAARAAQEGPLEVSSRMHSCMKVKLETMGRILDGLGVNMTWTDGTSMIPPVVDTAAIGGTAGAKRCDNLVAGVTFTTPASGACGGNVNIITPEPSNPKVTDSFDRATKIAQPARFVYCDGRLTLGQPLYSGRMAENTGLTTASITKQFDLFLAAATEIVDGTNTLSKSSRCMDPTTGKAAVLFNADNTCNEAGVSCLQGYPATPDQLALCSRLVGQASAIPGANVSIQNRLNCRDNSGNQTRIFSVAIGAPTMVAVPAVDAITTGKRLAVAAILSAAHSCD